MSRLGRMARKLRLTIGRGTRRGSGTAAPAPGGGRIGTSLARNEDALRSAFGESFDITFRHLRPAPGGRRLLMVYLRGAVDERLLARDILGKLSISAFQHKPLRAR